METVETTHALSLHRPYIMHVCAVSGDCRDNACVVSTPCVRAKKPVKKIKLFWYSYHKNTLHTQKKVHVSLSLKYPTN